MAPLRRVACLGVVVLTACSAAPGDSETDRQSNTLAEAISYPHQPDATALARAALDTRLGKSSNFSILEAKDLESHTNEDPFAHLVWRIHVPENKTGWNNTPALDACYTTDFNYFGPTSGPSRTTCPTNAAPLTPAPTPRRDIPPEYTPALEALLGKLPAAVSEAEVRDALTGLPAPQVDADTGLARVPPQVFVQVKRSDVGVALLAHTGAGDRDCMMGNRVGGAVKVWSLNWRDLGPLEKSCSAEAALAGP